MKDLVIGLSLLGMVSACSPAPQAKDNVEEDYCQYVNPFIGNADNGHTFPGACAPFGLIQASPESGVGSWRYCSGYNYEDNFIEGFAQTHLNGTGCPDLGDILLFPFCGDIKDNTYKSEYDKSTQKASPGYYAVTLSDYGVDAEITATAHTALHRYKFNNEGPARLLVDLQRGMVGSKDALKTHVLEAELEMPDNQTITGHNQTRAWVTRHYFYVIKFDRPSVPGKNLTLGIDIDLQRLGERLLQHKIGAIVAIEPATGEILCMVSSPTFDPHLMIGRQRGKNHRMLQRDRRKPLLNRAIMGAYPPGSTFKTAQALTFLQEGIIHEDYPTFPCAHGFNYGSLHVGCHGHGSPLSLIPAIATSCNSYFCWGLFRMFSDKKYGSPQNAITVWKDHMVSQGFGYRLGTDLPGEQRGLIPNAKFYDKAYRGSWNGLTVISISIGQGEILTTPLQIANLGATIANRGHFITPHIVKEIQDHELDSIYRTPRVTSIDREYYDEVAEGMRAAVTGSTGSATCRMVGTILPGVEACGKTGTAQNRGKDHSVFMGFAPMNNPKIAIAVYVENGGFGATYGVPIGAMMMDQYLHGKLSPENEIRAEEFSNRIILYGDEER